MSAHESMEHAEHAEHASGSNKKIALLIAVIALCLALSETLGKGAQTESISKNVEASNLWAFFQAKSIRRTVVQATAEHAKLASGPSLTPPKAALQKQIDDWQKTAARYRSEPETGEGSEQLSERAKHAEHERDEATAKYHHYEIASALFQIGIVLASATIITGIHRAGVGVRHAGAGRHRHHRARPLLAASPASALSEVDTASRILRCQPRSGGTSVHLCLGIEMTSLNWAPGQAGAMSGMIIAPRARSCENAGSAGASGLTSWRRRRASFRGCGASSDRPAPPPWRAAP